MSMAYPGITHCSECGAELNGWLGRCESCQQVKKDDKQAITGNKEEAQQVTGKLKLIDILNKIANGELKEGTRIKIGENIYSWNTGFMNNAFEGENDTYLDPMQCLGVEVELLEAEEPTDNTIKGLDADYYEGQPKAYTIRVIINKLNEVINKVNAQTVVVLSQEKDIEEIKEQLDY